MELICRGRPNLVEPLVVRVAMRFGLATAAITGWPTSDQYRILRLAKPGEGDAATPVVVVELQEIPGERTALILGLVAVATPELEQYAQVLVQELMRYEFLARPETPKGPLGFHLEPEDEFEGARLLDSFDAINSVEIKPSSPQPATGAATSGSNPDGAPAPPPASDR